MKIRTFHEKSGFSFFSQKNVIFPTKIDKNLRKPFFPKLFRIVLGVFLGLKNTEKRDFGPKKFGKIPNKKSKQIGTRNPSQMIERP